MSARTYAWVMTLGTVLLTGLAMWALLTGLMLWAYHHDSELSWGACLTGALSNWPFTVGFACFVGIGALSGFSPDDL